MVLVGLRFCVCHGGATVRLARDGGVSVDINVDCAAVIASRLTPTFLAWAITGLCPSSICCGSELAGESGVSATSMAADRALSRASPLPQLISGVSTVSAQGSDAETVTQCVVRGAHGGEWGLEGAAADHGHVRE